MNNLLIAIAVFVITVVGALFAVPYFIDWNSYRSFFEEEASRVIGREVQVDGEVKLHLLPTPYFRIEKVRIADAASAGLTEPFFKTESLTVKLSIPPMFRGIIEANDIEIQRPILRLAPDARDRWNWQSFAQALGAATYMPSNVALTSLKISNGVLALHGPDGLERARLEGLNGELSAPSLSGPYRFRGAFTFGGAERELRLATGAPEADGTLRLRASLRLVDSGATYLLDARLADLMGSPHVDGELTALLPVAGLWHHAPRHPSAHRRVAPEEEEKADASDAAFDLKAKVKADAEGAVLSELALSFEQGGRPQLVTGTVEASWRNALALDIRLSSRWLDLDRITGAAEGEGPLGAVAKIAAGLRSALPGYRSRIALAIDQANLGGEAIGAVQLLLARSAGAAQLEYLRANLPGGSRGELKGTISGPADALAFTGSMKLRGAGASRFTTWVTGSALLTDPRGDAPFGMDAQLAIAPGRVEARELVGNFAGTSLKGTAFYSWETGQELSLTLEGPQLDARAFLPAGSNLPGIYAFLTSHLPGNRASPGSRSPPDMRLALRTGLLVTAERSYRDVVADMQLRDGHLKQLSLRLAYGAGNSLELTGRLDDALSRPKGTLRGSVFAETASGLAAMMELLGLPQAVRPDDARARAMAPLRLAGSLAFAGRTATSTDLVADGEANGMTVKLVARLDGGPGDWKEEGADVSALVDAADPSKITALLFAGSAAGAGNAAPGRVLIKASGIPSQGLTSITNVAAGDLDAKFRGRLNFTDLGIKAAGDLEIRAADGAGLAALIGGAVPVRMDGLPVSANLRLTLGEGKFGLQDLAAQIGDAKVAGQVAFSRGVDRHHVEATLYADETNLSQLLLPLLDRQLALAGMAEAAISGRHGLWPDVPFNPSALDAVEGQLELNSRRLVLAERMALEEARLRIGFGAGRIEVKELAGKALGGQFGATLNIDKIGAGAEVHGKLTFSAAPERLSGQSTSSSGEPLSGSIAFSGRGTSPRAVIAAMQGKGSIELKQTKLAALWPGAIALAADAALKAEPERLAATVRRTIASGLASGFIPLGPRSIALEIGDGQLRTKPFVIETGEGRAGGWASLDLGSLNFRSQWRLEAKPPAAGSSRAPLPAVTVDYDGPVAALGELAPRVDTTALEQELSARKIERDVEELERLRKLDEQRRLMESERMRRQFEQTPPIQRPPLPPGVPIAPSDREPRPAAPG